MGAAPEWNWARGTDWAAAASLETQWPPSGAWTGQAAQAEAAPPPWIAAAQPAWPPPSTPSWPSASGTPPGLRSMSPTGGFYSLSMAPTSTKNRFSVLAAIDSNGEILDRSEKYNLQDFVKTPSKPNKPNKKRRGKGTFLQRHFGVDILRKYVFSHLSKRCSFVVYSEYVTGPDFIRCLGVSIPFSGLLYRWSLLFWLVLLDVLPCTGEFHGPGLRTPWSRPPSYP